MNQTNEETILIVEDDLGIATLQRRRLERVGFRVVVVGSAAEAIATVRQMPFDLVILDFRLPDGITGLDLHVQLKEAGYDLPVVMVTGYSDEGIIIRALRTGVRDFVTKSPTYLDYLPEAVEQVLRHVRMERELQEKKEQLRQAQKLESLGALAGGVAHEFNNLLQIITGFCEVAQDGLPTTDPRYECLEQVLEASERASSLTRFLLAFSRRHDLAKTILNPNATIDNLVKMLGPLIGANIEIQLELAADVGIVLGDTATLQQMLMNLCINARDAMPNGGRLKIATEDFVVQDARDAPAGCKPGRYVLVRVEDTGHGMVEDVKRRIFEPFFTTKPEGKGTGLGLAMVYGVVQQHEGAIEVESQPGAGTKFWVYLPVAHDPITSNSASDAPVIGGSEQILVAEDDSLVRALMAQILENAGYHVLEAEDGAEAVKLLAASHAQAAVLDFGMPKLDAREVYDRIKLMQPDIAVVLCTADASNTTIAEFAAEKGLPVLQKPFHPSVLLRTLRAVIDRAKANPVLVESNRHGS